MSQALWGTGGVVTKLVDKSLPSSLLVGFRHGIGALVLGISIIRTERPIMRNLPWLRLIIFSIVAAGLTDLLFVEAIRRCGAIIAVMLARLEIPLGVIFAHFFLKEKVGISAYLACVLSLAGVCLISYRPGVTVTLQDSFYLGVVLGITTGILWAGCSVYAKTMLNRKIDPLALSFVRLSIGSIFAFGIAIALVHHPFQALQNLAWSDWAWIIYLGIFLSGLAYLFYYKSLKIIDAHIALILSSVSIAVLLVLGLAIGERISILQWLGVATIGLSIYLVKKPATAD